MTSSECNNGHYCTLMTSLECNNGLTPYDNRTKQSQKLKISLIGLFPLRVETEVHAQKKVTSLPGAIAPKKIDILTPNKVWNMPTDLLLTSGMINSIGTFWPQNSGKSSLVLKGVKAAGNWKNMISHPNYGTYECNFWHGYTFITWAYDNL